MRSHPINVLGLVEGSGEKNIQREAVPLVCDQGRSGRPAESHSRNSQAREFSDRNALLKDPKSDNVLYFRAILSNLPRTRTGGNGDSGNFILSAGK